MKLSLHIIVHLVGFITVLLLTLVLVVMQIFRVDLNGKPAWQAWLMPQVWYEALGYRANKKIDACKMAYMPESTLSAESIGETICNPECVLNLPNPEDGSVRKIALKNDDGTNTSQVTSYYVDVQRSLVMYSTGRDDLSSRIVMSLDGELIQAIDESPGIHVPLQFLGYAKEHGYLVYLNPRNQQTLFYSANSIELLRRDCVNHIAGI